MAQTGIAAMAAPHDRILDLILAEPSITLKAIAAATGYSIAWISQIKRSDCFVAEYHRRRQGIESAIMQEIPERLNAIAHMAIDSLEEELRTNKDPEFTLDAFDKIMHRAGYAPKTGAPSAANTTNTQNNVFLVSNEDLSRAREKILNGNPAVVTEGLGPLLPTAGAAHDSGVVNAEVPSRT